MKTRRFAILLGLLCLSSTAVAETSVEVGEAESTLISAEGMVVSKLYNIDAEFGAKYEREIPAPYSFELPVSDAFKPWFTPPQPEDTTHIKVSFATEEKQLIENIRFIPFTLELKEEKQNDDRIKVAAQILANQAFQMATKGYTEVKRLAVVQSEIAGLDAVVVVGQYTDPSIGSMLVRLVGFLNPDSKHCVLAIANVNPSLSAATAPNKLHTDGITFQVIESFRFLGE